MVKNGLFRKRISKLKILRPNFGSIYTVENNAKKTQLHSYKIDEEVLKYNQNAAN